MDFLAPSSAPGPTLEPTTRDELARVLRAAETAPSEFRIGAEGEKFGVRIADDAPVPYGGPDGVCPIFDYLHRHHGWNPLREKPDGPVIGLRRDDASITLEPGAQLELSGAPLRDLHAIAAEQTEHLAELAPISRTLGIAWLTTGFHPTAHQDALPWVPKTRYPIMREYLPTRGQGALDMMRRTATVQANYDWASEADCMRKVRVALKLSPLIHALFANAPFSEGKASGLKSRRGQVWLNMDPTRSGLIPRLWEERTNYDDFVEWTLDAGMFLIWRDGVPVRNTGQTFRSFLQDGYEGHRATLADYKLHLTTLFPEVRLKNTLEVRSCDALPPHLALAAIAVWTGILYDQDSLGEADALTSGWDYATVQAARPGLVAQGLDAPLVPGDSSWDLALRIVNLARRGLEQRARDGGAARSEADYLDPAVQLLEQRKSPADLALEIAQRTGSLRQATEVALPG